MSRTFVSLAVLALTGSAATAGEQVSIVYRTASPPVRFAVSRIEAALAEPGVYEDHMKDRLTALLVDRGRLDRAIVECEARWLAAGEDLERAMAEPDDG